MFFFFSVLQHACVCVCNTVCMPTFTIDTKNIRLRYGSFNICFGSLEMTYWIGSVNRKAMNNIESDNLCHQKMIKYNMLWERPNHMRIWCMWQMSMYKYNDLSLFYGLLHWFELLYRVEYICCFFFCFCFHSSYVGCVNIKGIWKEKATITWLILN